MKDEGFVHSGRCYVDKYGNLTLRFWYFTSSYWTNIPLPDLGFNYGVFGDFSAQGCDKGHINIDDEDNGNNDEFCSVNLDNVMIENLKSKFFQKNIMKVGFNTEFIISQIKTKQ